MGGKRFRVGSVAVLFAVVTLCMAIFSTLTVVTAASDLRNARRYGEYVEKLYACQAMGEEWLAEADAAVKTGAPLPAEAWTGGESICAELERDGIRLSIRLRPEEGVGVSVEQWRCVTAWEPEESWELWGDDEPLLLVG